MNHAEALESMATEKYLLGELSPELRDAFEEHFFECPECAMDVRAASVFIEESKEQLPELTGPLAAPAEARKAVPASTGAAKAANARGSWWSSILRPAFAAPVFATLLAVVGYQNLITLPGLRASANEPRLASTVYLHAGTRSGETPVVSFDAKQGAVLAVDRPQQTGFTSLEFVLTDATGKVVMSLATPVEEQADGTLSLAIPGARLSDGAYTLAISGVTSTGSRSEIERHRVDFRMKH